MSRFNKIVAMRAYGNDFKAIQSEVILTTALKELVSQLTMPNLITVDTQDESKKKGDTVQVQCPVVFKEALEHGESSVATDIVEQVIDVKLNRQPYVEFKMTDREYNSMILGTIPKAFQGAINILAYTINAACIDMYKEVSYFSGDLISNNERTRFDLIKAKTGMDLLNAFGNRSLVLTSETSADFLKDFTSGNDQAAERDGIIGRRIGFNIYEENQAVSHRSGTASADAGIKTSAVTGAGSLMLAVSGASDGATFKHGDVIIIAGIEGSYCVASDAVAVGGSAVLTLTKALDVEVPANASVTVVGDHRVDMAFLKEAFMIVFRQLETPTNSGSTTISSLTDPNTGITLRLLSWYEPKTESTHWKLETLFGVKAIAPDRAIRMGGH
ncbi:P22 phage major capsid protein family protein [Pseudomonas asiatica]|uniref:P22 phage major capsid protein family protein n=1 Tax=Pseudomonas asiatica TaxID=2219225 RepID=UPI0010C04EDD|nr:P22 phage major capsid protein family protein [Pseudomonas asiatica]